MEDQHAIDQKAATFVVRFVGNAHATLPLAELVAGYNYVARATQLHLRTKLRDIMNLQHSNRRLATILGRAERLLELDLSWNGLRELPGSLAELQQLRQLTLSRNALADGALGRFPFRTLAELRRLMLDGCDLDKHALAALQLEGLTQLRELSLANNQLGGLPQTDAGLWPPLQTMPGLEALDLG